MKKIIIHSFVLIFGLVGLVQAENLNYNFINPSFIGGNVNNAAGLLNQANAQNRFKAPELSPYEKFQNNLQNAIFSKVQGLILDAKFPKGATAAGEYDTVGYRISIVDSGNNILTVTTTDKTTGAVTTFNVDTSN